MTETIECPRCGGKGKEILSLAPKLIVKCGGCKGTGKMVVPAAVVVTFDITEIETEEAA